MSTHWLSLRNGIALPMHQVPQLPFTELRQAVIAAPSHNRRVVAMFGRPTGNVIELFVVLASDNHGLLEAARTAVGGRTFPSMTPECPQVHLFERELGEQWGLVPEGHPWWKPVRFHDGYRPGPDAFDRPDSKDGEPRVVGVTDFYRVEGEEVHEVAVGPVHAGVIEPGHFRFQCHGEHVFHLEISLGYQHRGIERALVGGPDKRTIHHMETSGRRHHGWACQRLLPGP